MLSSIGMDSLISMLALTDIVTLIDVDLLVDVNSLMDTDLLICTNFSIDDSLVDTNVISSNKEIDTDSLNMDRLGGNSRGVEEAGLLGTGSS